MQDLLIGIVLAPLLGAVLNGLFGRFAPRSWVSAIGVGSVAISFALTVLAVLQLAGQPQPAALVQDVYEWFRMPLGEREVVLRVRLVFDALAAVMGLVVTGVGLLIHVYSTGYMEGDPGYARFFAYLNLFMASMLLLVLGSSLPLLFVGWEGVGLCSYLLIGFWYENRSYAEAGRKAFVMNRIGDAGVLAAMMVLLVTVGSLELSDINAAAPRLATQPLQLGTLSLGSAATVAALLLLLGCTGKSAQIPLYTWLPDAMAGPTPVSALIHAATMVTAGVYLCVRLSGLFSASPAAMAVVMTVGALTALLAACIAVAQDQMKKVLAFSTVSQLGFMFAAVGAGAFRAGIFHVMTHAFFKACLFLGAGSVMHAVGAHGDADVRRLGGLARKLPWTHWTFLVATMAIAGVPLTAGFFSKDMILMGVAAAGELGVHGEALRWLGWWCFGLLALAAVLTAFYMFRLYFLTFTGSYRGASASVEDEDEGHHGYAAHPHESPPSMTGVLVLLAVGSVLAGYVVLEPIGVPVDLWGRWLEGTVPPPPEGAHLAHSVAMAAGFGALLLGLGGAWVLYKGQAPDRLAERLPPGLWQWLAARMRVDELYYAAVVRPVAALARLAGWVDKTFVDGLLSGASSLLMRAGGWVLARLQAGAVHAYATVLVIGLALLGGWALYPKVHLRGVLQGERVLWRLQPGWGYAVRWDRDGDGTFDTPWSEGPEAFELQLPVEPGRFRGLALQIQGPNGQRHLLRVPADRWVRVPQRWLPEGWRDPEAKLLGPPVVRVQDDKLVVRAVGARLLHKGTAARVAALQVGQSALVGELGRGALLRAVGVVRVGVQVRSVFGYVRRAFEELVIVPGEAGGGGEALAWQSGAQEVSP